MTAVRCKVCGDTCPTVRACYAVDRARRSLGLPSHAGLCINVGPWFTPDHRKTSKPRTIRVSIEPTHMTAEEE